MATTTVPRVLTWGRLAEILDLPPWEAAEARAAEGLARVYPEAYREAIADGFEPVEAEARALACEARASAEVEGDWRGRVERAARETLRPFGLALDIRHPAVGGRIVPEADFGRAGWRYAAARVAQVIAADGFVGGITTGADLVRSGPYRDARAAVFAHLGIFRRAYLVFGGPAPRTHFDA